MVAFPIAKLASLLIKTLAKPMAKRVKHNFSRSSIGKNILISVGQTTHALTTRMTILSAGYKVRSIQALEKEAALKQGAELIGEGFIFSVAGALVVWEYDKSQKKEKKKEDEKKEKELKHREDIKSIETSLNDLSDRIRALEKTNQNISLQPFVEPKKNKRWLF